MSFRAVLFDLYGTLISYGNMNRAFSLWHEAIAKATFELGAEKSIPEIKVFCRNFFSRSITSNPDYTDYEERLLLLFNDCGVSPSRRWLKEFAAYSMDGWQAEMVLHPEALELIVELKNRECLIGVITNFEHPPHIYKVLRDSRILPLLDTVIISGEVRLKKPDPQIFTLALRKLHVSASQTLFVGDDLEKDIKGAKNIGMSTFFVNKQTSLLSLLNILENHNF